MADGKVLEFSGVTKVFGDVSAVSELTARIEPGVVTAFLGPNGAGKTTSLRILLGDVRATSGSATIGGTPYSNISRPARTVGAVLESPTFRQRRTATRQLTSVAKANGIPLSRVREVIDLVGLADVADIKIAGFSLGMRQRLAVAQALLGDPGVLIFDEPVNGMDPEGIRWMRLLMRRLADEGRTVLMSSHLLSEVQQIADRILIISNGTLVFSGGIEELADVDPIVAVDSPDRAALTRVLRDQGYEFEVLRSGVNVRDASARDLGRVAAEAGIALSVLHQRGASLEDVFLDLVNGRSTRQTAALPRESGAVSAGAEADAAEDAGPSTDGSDTDAADAVGAVGDAVSGAAGA
ncbi:MAG: ABC transporter ATP-binding protein, partial [Microbacterium sp.]